MSLQLEQVISSSATGKEKDATDWVWRVMCYEVLPFVMDCNLATAGSESGQYSASCCDVLVITSDLIDGGPSHHPACGSAVSHTLPRILTHSSLDNDMM